jgi:hypothetical protein
MIEWYKAIVGICLPINSNFIVHSPRGRLPDWQVGFQPPLGPGDEAMLVAVATKTM